MWTSLNKIERRIGAIEDEAFKDNVMMALIKEEEDTEANLASQNKVTIKGFVLPPNFYKLQDKERIDIMRRKVQALVAIIKNEDQTFDINFIRHLNRKEKHQSFSILEVRFGDSQQALNFRSQFVKVRQEERHQEHLAALNVYPVVRLATRVRVEMLQSIAEQMKKMDTTILRAYCSQFVPRPIIKIVRKNSAGVEVTSTKSFIEAVCWVKEENVADSIDWKKAQDRVGSSSCFAGHRKAQYFVILD